MFGLFYIPGLSVKSKSAINIPGSIIAFPQIGKVETVEPKGICPLPPSSEFVQHRGNAQGRFCGQDDLIKVKHGDVVEVVHVPERI